MNALKIFRAWMREQCPLVDKNNRFNLNYLGSDPVAYNISSAGDSHRKDIIGGDIATYSFTFSARMPYGVVLETNMQAAEFFSELSEWLRAQDEGHKYPVFPGYNAVELTVANAGMVVAVDPNTAQYQIQIQLTLEEAYNV